MSASVYAGTQIAATVRYTDLLTGEPADPTTASVVVQDPDGTETTYTYPTSPEYTKSETGVYVLVLTLNTAGRWWFRGRAAGSFVGVNERFQNVIPSHFASP